MEYKPSIYPLSDDKITLPDLDPDTCAEIIKYANDLRQNNKMMVIEPEDMVVQSFLSNPTDNGTIDNGERHRAFIVKRV